MEPETQEKGSTEDGEKLASAPDIITRTARTSCKPVRGVGSGVAVDGGATSHSRAEGNGSFFIGSLKSSPIPTDPKQSFVKEEPSVADEDSESEMAAEADSLHQTKLNLGTEAPPGSWAENSSDVEEAADDVEFPEAVILVGKTQWRCITCMTYYSQFTSIDQHIRVHHKKQTHTAKRGVSRPVGRPPGRTSTGRISTRTASSGQGLPKGKAAKNFQAELTTGKTLRKPHVEMGESKVATYKPTVRERTGRGTRGGKGRGGQGRGGRGRELGLFSPKLDDSDTEPECVPTVQPKSLPARKRKTRSSVEIHSNESSAAPTTKILKLSNTVDAPIEPALLKKPSHVPLENVKESFREKYLMVVLPRINFLK